MAQNRDILQPIRPGTILLAIAILIHFSLVYWIGITQDDAFITFRYAEQFLKGNGLVFNPGEQIEGYTNFFWLILMILGKQAGFTYTFWAKLLGLISGAAKITITYRITYDLSETYARRWRDALAGTAALLLGSALSFAYWSGAGLETSAFTFTVALTVSSYLRRSSLVIPGAVLATLLRPEGVLLFVVVVLGDIAIRRRITAYTLRTAILYLAFLFPYAVFKYLYFGSLIPNTFWAKTGLNAQKLFDGLAYTAQYFWQYLFAGLFLIPFLIYLRRFAVSARILVIAVAASTLSIIFLGGDVLKVHRFFVPIMPLTVSMIVIGCNEAFRRKGVFFAAIVVILIWRTYSPLHHVTTFRTAEIGLAEKMGRLSNELKEVDRSQFSVATSTIGRFSFNLIDHTVIDLLGLTDSTIAKHPAPPITNLESSWREAKYNSAYVLSRQPDYIVFSTGFKPSAPAERALFCYSAFLNAYRTIPLDLDGQLHNVYKRYFPIEEKPERDVDIKLANLFHRAGNLIGSKDSLDAAVACLDSAVNISPEPKYPYLYYYIAYALSRANYLQPAYNILTELAARDTLVCQTYIDLYWFETRAGNTDRAEYCRSRVLELAPWVVPRLDSLVR